MKKNKILFGDSIFDNLNYAWKRHSAAVVTKYQVFVRTLLCNVRLKSHSRYGIRAYLVKIISSRVIDDTIILLL